MLLQEKRMRHTGLSRTTWIDSPGFPLIWMQVGACVMQESHQVCLAAYGEEMHS
jgi:hypothetical protein